MNMELSVVLIDNVPTIWQKNDWRELREQGIIGTPIGASQGPPIAIIPEAAKYLEERGKSCKSVAQLAEIPLRDDSDMAEKARNESFRVQKNILKAKRKQEILDQADKIIKGKRKSIRFSSKDDHSILQEEIEKIKEPHLKYLAVQIPSVDPWTELTLTESVSCTPLKFTVYKALKESKWIVGDGGKFGVDFACYPGDPCRFHAQILVCCFDYDELFTPMKLITLGRLANTVNKILVFASRHPDTLEVKFQTVSYHG